MPRLPLASLAVLLAALSAGPLSVSAQNYIHRDGTVLAHKDVQLVGDALVQRVSLPGGGSFERRYPLADIARLDFPVPETVLKARAELLAGRPAEALAAVTPTYQAFAPFARIPGGHFETAALLRLRALIDKKDDDAKNAANELIRLNLSPSSVSAGRLALAELEARAGRSEIASFMIEEAVKNAPPETQARAWILRGDLASARADHEVAAEAYLRVQAFYGQLDHLLPYSLLAAARSVRAFGDKAFAERLFGEVMDTYPDTPEGALARKELGF